MAAKPKSVSQTANTSAQADPLQQACRLVGLFQYHFARIEQRIDQGVIKLLDLDYKAGPIVTGSVDFAKKLNLLWAVAYEQATDDKGRKFVDKTCGAVFTVNDDRQVVIHSSFEPAPNGGVRFKRPVAKRGRFHVNDPVWDDKKFDAQYKKMTRLADDLDQLVEEIKPAPTVGRLGWVTVSGPVRLRIDPIGSTKPDRWIKPIGSKKSDR
jgi:hypothetical protein